MQALGALRAAQQHPAAAAAEARPAAVAPGGGGGGGAAARQQPDRRAAARRLWQQPYARAPGGARPTPACLPCPLLQEAPGPPGLMLAAAAAGVRLALLNARLAGEAYLGWYCRRASRQLMRDMLAGFTLLVPQSDVDVGRWVAGVVCVCGGEEGRGASPGAARPAAASAAGRRPPLLLAAGCGRGCCRWRRWRRWCRWCSRSPCVAPGCPDAAAPRPTPPTPRQVPHAGRHAGADARLVQRPQVRGGDGRQRVAGVAAQPSAHLAAQERWAGCRCCCCCWRLRQLAAAAAAAAKPLAARPPSPRWLPGPGCAAARAQPTCAAALPLPLPRRLCRPARLAGRADAAW
jgi:hypothetical protein